MKHDDQPSNVRRTEQQRAFFVFCRACEKLGVADNTYFFYSSDHGFQLGEFNIPMDKRQV